MSLRVRNFISCKEAELDCMLLLNINRKEYILSHLKRLHFPLVTSKDQCQGHSDFETLYLVKEQN